MNNRIWLMVLFREPPLTVPAFVEAYPTTQEEITDARKRLDSVESFMLSVRMLLGVVQATRWTILAVPRFPEFGGGLVAVVTPPQDGNYVDHGLAIRAVSGEIVSPKRGDFCFVVADTLEGAVEEFRSGIWRFRGEK